MTALFLKSPRSDVLHARKRTKKMTQKLREELELYHQPDKQTRKREQQNQRARE